MKPEQFAEQVLRDLNDEFEDDASYCEALEELIDRAQSMLDAKREELGDDAE
jgi:hypothetical protein